MLRDEAVTAWIKFFIWKNFTSVFNIDSYLSYHNYASDHIYRNILLKQINCFTIMYKHTHSENVFDYKKKQNYAYAIYMNLYYDLECHWSNWSIEMSKANQSKSTEYLLSGPIWSSEEFLNKNKNNIININKNNTTLGFFTSSYPGFSAVNSIDSHQKFLLFVLEIIKRYPNFNILFKSKNDFKLYESKEKTKEIAKKTGIDLPLEPWAEIKRIIQNTSENKCSMLQDLENGNQTEIDALNGEIIRIANDNGLDAPYNKEIMEKIISVSN